MKDILTKYRFEIIVSILVTLIITMSVALVYQWRKDADLPAITTPSSPVSTCSENWTCESWGRCSDEGEETRVCRDLNNCGTEIIKPRTTQSCEPFVFVEPELGPFDIEIRGDAQCQADISEALSLLEEKAPEYYTDVRKYVGVIECVNNERNRSEAFPTDQPPRITINPSTPDWSIEYIASVVVHEMIHSREYNSFLINNRPDRSIVPDCEYRGVDKEIEITREQIQFLKRISAPEFEVDSVQQNIDDPPNVWSDLNCN